MSKQQIEAMIPDACKAIEKYVLSEEGKVDGKLRSQISSFGAAITMGNLLSAVAFFSKKGNAESDRPLLMKTIYSMIFPNAKKETITGSSLLEMLIKEENPDVYKEKVINTAIAIKLAMNLYAPSDDNPPKKEGA